MNIGFKPKKGKKYLYRNCFSTILHEEEVDLKSYLITVQTESNNFRNILVNEDKSLYNKVIDRIREATERLLIVDRVVVSNYDLLAISAYLSNKKKLDTIEIVENIDGVPIELGLGMAVGQVAVVCSDFNSLVLGLI